MPLERSILYMPAAEEPVVVNPPRTTIWSLPSGTTTDRLSPAGSDQGRVCDVSLGEVPEPSRMGDGCCAPEVDMPRGPSAAEVDFGGAPDPSSTYPMPISTARRPDAISRLRRTRRDTRLECRPLRW